MQPATYPPWVYIASIILLIVIVLIIINYKKPKKKVIENKYEKAIDIADNRFPTEYFPPIGYRPPKVKIEVPDLLKDTIDRVEKKSKEIGIRNIVSGLKEHAEQKENDPVYKDLEEKIGQLTDEERANLQAILNNLNK